MVSAYAETARSDAGRAQRIERSSCYRTRDVRTRARVCSRTKRVGAIRRRVAMCGGEQHQHRVTSLDSAAEKSGRLGCKTSRVVNGRFVRRSTRDCARDECRSGIVTLEQ